MSAFDWSTKPPKSKLMSRGAAAKTKKSILLQQPLVYPECVAPRPKHTLVGVNPPPPVNTAAPLRIHRTSTSPLGGNRWEWGRGRG